MSSGSKRPRDDAAALPYDGVAPTSPPPKKPRDWRDAFLNDGSADHSHGRGSRHSDDRYRSGRDHRDRYGESRHRSRSRSRSRDGHHRRDARGDGRVSYDDRRRREDDRGGRHSRHSDSSRGYDRYASDGRDRRRDRSRERGDRSSRSSSRKLSQPPGAPGGTTSAGTTNGDREEGEIAPEPLAVPAAGPPSASNLAQRSVSPSSSHPAPADISKPAVPATAADEDIPAVPLNPTDEAEDLEAKLEARRRRRQELMEKLAGTQSGVGSVGALSSVGGALSVGSQGKATSEATTPALRNRTAQLQLASTAGTPVGHLTPTADGTFDLAKDSKTTGANAGVDGSDMIPETTRADNVDGEPQVSAAEYDPNQDREDDEKRLHRLEEQNAEDAKAHAAASAPTQEVHEVKDEESEYEEVEMEDEDEDFDMFAMDEPKKKKTIRRKKQKQGGPSTGLIAPIPVIPALQVSTLVDTYDDAEGYYRITPGELLDGGSYQVTTNLGKGMFSAVIKAKVLVPHDEEKLGAEVAIKVIRSQESMYVAGRKEAQILQRLASADPGDKKHIVRFIRTFEHRGHLCIVTESLSMNLRDVVKRFGKDVGLNIRAVRAYAHQIFLALSLMKKCAIVHADIKPDNILVTENKTILKVCDLGSACEPTADGGEFTPYLVSRFYRAPEIILGLPYDESLDIWAVGCTLFELYTGKILFPGRSNNQMLHLMMELKGKFAHRMIKKSRFGEMHFDEGMNFRSVEKDKITGQDVTKTIIISRATRDLKIRLLPPSSVQLKMRDDELKLITDFIDLLDKCLSLDPAKRLSARDALLHPFLAAGTTAAAA